MNQTSLPQQRAMEPQCPSSIRGIFVDEMRRANRRLPIDTDDRIAILRFLKQHDIESRFGKHTRVGQPVIDPALELPLEQLCRTQYPDFRPLPGSADWSVIRLKLISSIRYEMDKQIRRLGLVETWDSVAGRRRITWPPGADWWRLDEANSTSAREATSPAPASSPQVVVQQQTATSSGIMSGARAPLPTIESSFPAVPPGSPLTDGDANTDIDDEPNVPPRHEAGRNEPYQAVTIVDAYPSPPPSPSTTRPSPPRTPETPGRPSFTRTAPPGPASEGRLGTQGFRYNEAQRQYAPPSHRGSASAHIQPVILRYIDDPFSRPKTPRTAAACLPDAILATDLHPTIATTPRPPTSPPSRIRTMSGVRTQTSRAPPLTPPSQSSRRTDIGAAPAAPQKKTPLTSAGRNPPQPRGPAYPPTPPASAERQLSSAKTRPLRTIATTHPTGTFDAVPSGLPVPSIVHGPASALKAFEALIELGAASNELQMTIASEAACQRAGGLLASSVFFKAAAKGYAHTSSRGGRGSRSRSSNPVYEDNDDDDDGDDHVQSCMAALTAADHRRDQWIKALRAGVTQKGCEFAADCLDIANGIF